MSWPRSSPPCAPPQSTNPTSSYCWRVLPRAAATIARVACASWAKFTYTAWPFAPDTRSSSARFDRIVVFGIPGYPVSAALTSDLFVRPLLARWLGIAPLEPPLIRATLTRSLASPMGEDEFVRVRLARIDERTLAAPLSRGAGVLSSLLRADGIAQLPRFHEGAAAGSKIEVQTFRSDDELAHTALLQGSHDPLLELLSHELSAQRPPCRLVMASVGSLGGLVALRRQHAHLAGSHLLHPPSGEFNLHYVREQLADLPLRLVTFVEREQGLLVARGNPLGIKGIADLPHIRYVNRQRGAGTRLLLDEQLRAAGIANTSDEGSRPHPRLRA